MQRAIEYAVLFLVMVILQVFLFSRVGFSIYLHPLPYVAFIVLLPMEIVPVALLGLGLLTGLTMDFFMATSGINTISTLFVSFCRPTLLGLLAGKDEVRDGGIPNVNRLGFKKFIRYAGIMSFLLCASFFMLESLSWKYFHITALRIVLSWAVTLLLVYLCQRLFSVNRKKS